MKIEDKHVGNLVLVAEWEENSRGETVEYITPCTCKLELLGEIVQRDDSVTDA